MRSSMAGKLIAGIVWRAAAILALTVAQQAKGQVSLCGDVTDEDGVAAQFVNVALFAAADTSAVLCGGVTDCDGHFALRAVRPGNYVVALSAVGYETSRQDVRLRMPSAGTSVRKAMVIRRAEVKIDEVTATASRKSEAAGKSTYTFSQSQIGRSRHAADLISGIEELRIDPQTDRLALTSAKPGELMILINGVAATDEDLKAVPPAKVVRCEYYSLPPARYASVAAVVNVVTKPLDDGWACGADATSALSTGFVNASAYARFFRGNHQFGLDYLLSLRDYDDRRSSTSYAFGLSDGSYSYDSEVRDAFGYADNQIRLKYLYSTSDGTAFQAIFKPDFRRQWADGDAFAILSLPREYLSASGFTYGRNKTFGPSLDLYYSRRVRGTDRLDVNVVGTYFGNRQTRMSLLSADTVRVVDDDMTQDTKKRSVIAEAAYVWQFTPPHVSFCRL
ncbi:MAG: carboxypeptidase-like regulatory domain-containing protein [Marinilabiliaceae bacterium]